MFQRLYLYKSSPLLFACALAGSGIKMRPRRTTFLSSHPLAAPSSTKNSLQASWRAAEPSPGPQPPAPSSPRPQPPAPPKSRPSSSRSSPVPRGELAAASSTEPLARSTLEGGAMPLDSAATDASGVKSTTKKTYLRFATPGRNNNIGDQLRVLLFSNDYDLPALKKIFTEIQRNQYVRQAVTADHFHILFRGIAQSGDFSFFKAVSEDMEKLGIVPTAAVYYQKLKFWASKISEQKMENLVAAEKVYRSALKNRSLNAAGAAAMASVYEKLSMYPEVATVLQEYVSQGATAKLDSSVFHPLFNIAADIDNPPRLGALFELMQQYDLEPDLPIFNSLARYFSEKADGKHLYAVVDDIQAAGLEPDGTTYTCIARYLRIAEDKTKFDELISSIPRDKYAAAYSPLWLVQLGAYSQWHDHEGIARIRREMTQYPVKPAHYMLLARHYARHGDRAGFDSVVQLMKLANTFASCEQRGASKDWRSANVVQGIVLLYQKFGDSDQAQEFLEYIEKVAPTDSLRHHQQFYRRFTVYVDARQFARAHKLAENLLANSTYKSSSLSLKIFEAVLSKNTADLVSYVCLVNPNTAPHLLDLLKYASKQLNSPPSVEKALKELDPQRQAS